MKQKKLALMGLAVVAGLALASCGDEKPSTSTTPSKSESSSTTTPVKKGEYTYTDAPADETYATEGGRLDIHLAYNGTAGVTYQGATAFINAVDGKTYNKGALLPTWKAFAEKTKTTIVDASKYGYEKEAGAYAAIKEKNFKADNTTEDVNIDLFFNKTANLLEMAKEKKAVNLKTYIDNGSMPYFKAWLDKNPTIAKQLTQSDGGIYYTPYFDGYNDTERMLNMDTQLVSMVLDGESKDTEAAKGDNKLTDVKYTPFMDAEKNLPADQLKVAVVGSDNKKTEITLKQTTNIIKQQNEKLAGTCTGKDLADQLKKYIDDVYGDYIGEGKLYATRAEVFTSAHAAYNADELIALMRVVKANPKTITGDAEAEVEILIPRGQNDSRVENILDFAQIWGVQSLCAEKDMLYFDANGKLNDGATTQASYDALTKLNALYSEGLILGDFWAKTTAKGTEYLDKYWKKTVEGAGYALMMYDYSATQSAANDLEDGIGIAAAKRTIKYESKGIMPILPPLTYWATETNWDHTQSLDTKTGKTLTRYYEENRSLKDSSWSIPSNSDNVEGAIRLMDYMYSPKGSMINDFGPEEYWETDVKGKVRVATNIADDQYGTPVMSKTNKQLLATTGKDFWTYMRENIGATHGIGAIRSKGLQIEACNKYSQTGAMNLSLAISTGVVTQCIVDKASTYTWDTTVPTTFTNNPSKEQGATYAALTEFWNAKKLGKNEGWVAVVSGTAKDDSATVVTISSVGYTYAQVKAQWETKNKTYLYILSECVNAVPDYAKAA